MSISFCPFNPDTQPSVCPTLRLAVVEGMGRGMGMAPAGVSIVSLVVEVREKGMGMAPAGVPIASLVVEVMGRGMGMAPGVIP